MFGYLLVVLLENKFALRRGRERKKQSKSVVGCDEKETHQVAIVHLRVTRLFGLSSSPGPHEWNIVLLVGVEFPLFPPPAMEDMLLKSKLVKGIGLNPSRRPSFIGLSTNSTVASES